MSTVSLMLQNGADKNCDPLACNQQLAYGHEARPSIACVAGWMYGCSYTGPCLVTATLKKAFE